MANEYYIAPVNHSTTSAAASTLGGGAVGALGGAFKGWGVTTLIGAAVGLLGGLLLVGVFPAIGVGSTLAFLGKAAVVLATTAAAGVATGTFIAPWVGGATGIYGGVKGASRASDKVAMERGAAAQLQAEIAASPYQAMASNDNKYNLPAHGSHLNAAFPQIDAASASLDGRLAAQQLQRA